jgi:phosphoglycolate phosphatase
MTNGIRIILMPFCLKLFAVTTITEREHQPIKLADHTHKQSRSRLQMTLTDVYRHEAYLFPGIASLIKTLLATPDVRVGLVTRNVTIDPKETLKCLFIRHGIDIGDFDFFACLPLSQNKSAYFKKARHTFAINPARTFACGDEHSDYLAAIAAGIHPFVVSYGFESHNRLTKKFDVPNEVISNSPEEFISNLLNALNLEMVSD